jgi:hypothetical protein
VMLDLLSIEEIKPIKDDVRCRTCVTFSTIVHASDIWQIEDDKFVRIDVPIVESCHLVDLICKGSIIRTEDYVIIDGCSKYVQSEEWDGISKTFINIITSLIDYLILTENKEFDKLFIMEIAKTLESTSVANVSKTEEVENKDLREQFKAEARNYDMMEAVRSLVYDT